MELVQLLKKTVWRFLKTTKNRATLWFSNPTTGHISKENKILKRHMYSNVHCSTIYNSQDMEATQMSINRWMDKDVVYIYNGISLSNKKEWNAAICSNMNESRDYHTKWGESDRKG